MGSIAWILVAIVSLALVFAGVLLFRGRLGFSRPSDSDTFIILGTVWLIVGLSSDTSGLWIIGIVFLAIGLARRRRSAA